jgi:hypothetical protein
MTDLPSVTTRPAQVQTYTTSGPVVRDIWDGYGPRKIPKDAAFVRGSFYRPPDLITRRKSVMEGKYDTCYSQHDCNFVSSFAAT